jgi:hypothetical protein
MLCKGVGIGTTLNPESGEVGVMLSLHDEDGDDHARGWIVLEPQRAVEISMALMARASEAHRMLEEIMNTPMDDRPAKVAQIVARLHGPIN